MIAVNHGSFGISTPVLRTYEDQHPHLKRMERVDRRGEFPSTQLSPAEEHALMRRTAEGKGTLADRVVRTPEEAAATQARLMRSASANDSKAIAVLHEDVAALTVLVRAQAGQITELLALVPLVQQLQARLDIVDGGDA